jgi:hypothetical protein
MTWRDVLAVASLLLTHGGMAIYAVGAMLCELEPRGGRSPEAPAGVPPRAASFLLTDGEVWDLETEARRWEVLDV